jgi:thiol-disulfide isomerase/thioredoxin
MSIQITTGAVENTSHDDLSPLLIEFLVKDIAVEAAKHNLFIAAVTAHWCSHCKKLIPEMSKLAQSTEKSPVCYAFADVAREKWKGVEISSAIASKNDDKLKEMKVSGYPTITVWQKGKQLKNYNGKRDAHSLAQFVQALLASA